MGGAACVKKRMCNPPALARIAIPEQILDDIASGLLNQEEMEKAGLYDYLYRRAYLDEHIAEKCKEADDWFYNNVHRLEYGKAPEPKPSTWKEKVK